MKSKKQPDLTMLFVIALIIASICAGAVLGDIFMHGAHHVCS